MGVLCCTGRLILGTALAVVPAAFASPPHYETSTLVGEDRNGLPLEPGDLVDWTIVVINSGYGDEICDIVSTLDPALDFVAASDFGIYSPGTRSVRWVVPKVTSWGGQVTLRLTTAVAAVPATVGVVNQAFITGWWTADPDGTHDPRVATTPRTSPATPRPSAVPADAALLDLRFAVEEMSGDGLFSAGEPVRYTLALTNLGNTAFDGLTVTALLPAELESIALGSLPAGATDISDVGGRWLEVGGIALPVEGSAHLVVDGRLKAATPGGTRLCTRAEVRGPTLRKQRSEAQTPVGGDTCFTSEATGLLVLSSIQPCRGWSRGGTTVVLEGTGFAAGAEVTFGGLPAAVSSLTPTRIVATTPATPSTIAYEQADVVVRNPDLGASSLPASWYWTCSWPLGVRELKLTKVAGQVDFYWGKNVINFVMARSSDPRFECGETKWWPVPTVEFTDAVLDDGKTWFYRTE